MINQVNHLKEKQLFYIDIENQRATLTYIMEKENVMNFMSTYVPDSFRGKGIAAKLVKEGLHYAKENNFRVIPACSYVYSFIKNHQEYKPLVFEE